LAGPRRPGQKKLRTREHVIADLGINHVERHILRRGFAVGRCQPDYGIDLVMFTYTEGGEIENGDVRFQVKATESPRILTRQKTIAQRVSYADVKHWMYEHEPVILVVYDAKNDQAYWVYVQDYLDSGQRPLEVLDDLESTTFHVPMANCLNVEAIERFRQYRDQRWKRWK